MKLYIWDSPYNVSWGGSCLYVLAYDLEQAKELALTASVSNYGYNPVQKMSIKNLGAPTRIVEGPYAEVFEWSE